MKSKTFKKSSNFVEKISVVISHILNIVYVIPFYAVVGAEGGALYGYAYTIYSLFMSLAITAIPLAMSSIVSEYQTLGYYTAKKRAFLMGKRVALLVGFISFLIILFFAPMFAKFIFGDLVAGNSINDIIFVIRVVSSAMLVAPILGIYRGVFRGHRLNNILSNSQVLERIVCLLFIVVVSFMTGKIFKLSNTVVVSISLIGFMFGILVSYLYLLNRKVKNQKKFTERIRNVNEPIITNKTIYKKLLMYALPFLFIDVYKALYTFIDMTTVVKGLVNLGKFSILDAEIVMSMFSVWGAKFNTILVSLSIGVVASLLPVLSKSIEKRDYKECNKKINKIISILLFVLLPITVIVSFLAEPIWLLFYGSSKYGASVLAYFIFVGLIMGLFYAAISIVRAMKDYKTLYFSLIVGLLIKLLLNTSMIETFHQYGMPGYYGVITTSILAYLVSFIVCLVSLYIKYKVDYETVLKNFMDILCGCMLMVVVLFLMKFLIPIVSKVRIANLGILVLYILVGTVVYLLFMVRMGTIKSIFGTGSKNKK